MQRLRKKGAVVGDLISGTGGLVVMVVVILVIVSTLLGANLLTGTQNASAYALGSNFTSGVDNVATKIPTV